MTTNPRRDFSALRLAAFAGVLALTAGAGFYLRDLGVGPHLLLPRATHSVRVIEPSPNVVTAIRDLKKLESAEYHLERVMDVKDEQSRAFGLIHAEDALLLVVAGDVVAGVDLSELDANDIVVDQAAKSVRVTLPAPKILSTRLDSQRTYVHTRNTDLLAHRNERLESEARATAEKELGTAARDAGILDRAGTNARRTVQDLLTALGFRVVEVSVAKS